MHTISARTEALAQRTGCAPIPNASVTIVIGTGDDPCGQYYFSGVTDANGTVLIPLTGAGCRHQVQGACVVVANGVTIRSYSNAKSADWDGGQGDGRVDVRDLVAFRQAVQGGGPGCHDYNNNGYTELGDLILFASAFSPMHVCR